MLTLPRLRARARSETLERMTRLTLPLAALALALPLAAQAQAFRCTDATGRVLYTDQPCAGGDLVAARALQTAQVHVRLACGEVDADALVAFRAFPELDAEIRGVGTCRHRGGEEYEIRQFHFMQILLRRLSPHPTFKQ